MAGIDKVMTRVAGKPLVWHSVEAFLRSDEIDEIVIVTRADLEERLRREVDDRGLTKVRRVVRGGETRQESSRHGLAALSRDVDIVLVHDAARPLVTGELIERVVRAAATDGAAVPGVAPVSTIKTFADGASLGTVDRTTLREAQTPQGFRRDVLARAFAAAIRDGYDGTDETSLVERTGERVAIVEGDRRNLKITVPDDLAVAEAFLSGGQPPRRTRIGFGQDVHRLVEGRPLVLGGVTIPHTKGLLGHSDADVLAHAICDALLGAAGAGDLGEHFPDTDDEWKGAAGATLIARTVEILSGFGYVPVNVDAMVSAQAPRLASWRPEMVKNLAEALRLPESSVSVKFGTTERLGFEGREEGISATAVALVATLPSTSENP
ncbi:MAG: 2-C-methyl-D-erythritol 2,4-cyclodiphosphate synthase [Gemmatimonadetes bacterium]|nr:2-C-methyl-D-erythritol 2,4-cyclodiphosphate synthase [Gemmatimonadota bacterium]